MPKKCPPGIICIENMTLVFLFIILALIGYIMYNYQNNMLQRAQNEMQVNIPSADVHHHHNQQRQQHNLLGISTRLDPLNDPYSPPLKQNGYYHAPDSGDIRGIPVNIETRGLNMEYQQVGILTKQGGMNENLIVPLMGRRLMSGRDNWQYYTISNTGQVNTKLPISVNGKSCSGEYGCDEIYNGTNVYVEGYNDTFLATIYENGTFKYIPYL
jgi:hypothetical protein